MGSQSDSIWPANKTVPFGLFLCSLAMFLLPVLSDAKTFVFTPTKQPANYSDTANWVNRDYPGRQIVYGDTLLFQQSVYNTVIIDSSLQVGGYLYIADSLHFNISKDVEVYIVGNTGSGVYNLAVLNTSASSIVTINGYLFLRSCAAHFYGTATINGEMSLEGKCFPVEYQGIGFNKIQINGYLHGTNTFLSGDTLWVGEEGRIELKGCYYNQYIQGAGAIYLYFVFNAGTIDLDKSVKFQCNFLENSGTINLSVLNIKKNNDYGFGYVHNGGNININNNSSNELLTLLVDVVNYGNLYLKNDSSNRPTIVNLQNFGTLLLEHGTVLITGNTQNFGTFLLNFSDTTSEISGGFLNEGSITAYGRVLLTQQAAKYYAEDYSQGDGYFMNHGKIDLNIGTNGLGWKVANDFYNFDTVSVIGSLLVSGRFYNFKTLIIR